METAQLHELAVPHWSRAASAGSSSSKHGAATDTAQVNCSMHVLQMLLFIQRQAKQSGDCPEVWDSRSRIQENDWVSIVRGAKETGSLKLGFTCKLPRCTLRNSVYNVFWQSSIWDRWTRYLFTGCPSSSVFTRKLLQDREVTPQVFQKDEMTNPSKKTA